MFVHKHLSVNNAPINEFPFTKELSMEAYLLENENILSLEMAGFDDIAIVESEVVLLDKKISIDGKTVNKIDGRIDILATYGEDHIAIVELKLGELTNKHLKQLEGYLENRSQILKKFTHLWDTNFSGKPNWIGIMVGKTINPTLMKVISDGYLYNKEIPIAALTINRYRGDDGNIYVITDTYFKNLKSKKDLTKYRYGKGTYGKGQLVLAVVKQYVATHPSINYSSLKTIFPDRLGGKSSTSHVFTTHEEALKIYFHNPQKPRKRHFIDSTQLIKLNDGETIAVSNQWGGGKNGNIQGFIEYCRSVLNLTIIEETQ